MKAVLEWSIGFAALAVALIKSTSSERILWTLPLTERQKLVQLVSPAVNYLPCVACYWSFHCKVTSQCRLNAPLPECTTAWMHHCLNAPLSECTTAWMHHCLNAPTPSLNAPHVWTQWTGTPLTRIITAQWEGIGDVGSTRYKPALHPTCPTIRVLSYRNC